MNTMPISGELAVRCMPCSIAEGNDVEMEVLRNHTDSPYMYTQWKCPRCPAIVEVCVSFAQGS